MIGTLIWVGDTTADEFRGAVQFCLLNVSQIAFRRDVGEAELRPASDVRWILFSQSDRSGADRQRLLARYPKAKSITMRGALCLGMRSPGAGEAFDWYDWKQVLPAWLGTERLAERKCQTVAVVAATLATAEPLLDLAESCGATAVWCRQPGGNQLRNIDAVWWDDSIARPASEVQWSDRIAMFKRRDRPVQHAWIANAPTIWDAREAQAAGVGYLVSKPHRIDILTEMLRQPATHQPARRAA